MARTFYLLDSFDAYDTAADIAVGGKWSSADTPALVEGRFGGQAVEMNSQGEHMFAGLPNGVAVDRWVMFGCAVKFKDGENASPGGNMIYGLGISSMGGPLRVAVGLCISQSNRLFLFSGDNNVDTNSFSNAEVDTSLEGYKFIEMAIKLPSGADNTGQVRVAVDGVEIITYNGSDLIIDAEEKVDANYFQLGSHTPGKNTNFNWDDLYVAASTDSDPPFLGGARFEVRRPAADEDLLGFTPSSGDDGYAMVDDDLGLANDGTYVSSGSADARAMFSNPEPFAIPPDQIFAVGVTVRAKKVGAGAVTLQTRIISGAETELGDAVGLSTDSQHIHTVYGLNPNGDVAWTDSAVVSLDFGAIIDFG